MPFPGGVVGPEDYWAFLANGGDAISEVPPDRWDADAFYDPDPFAPGRMASKWGGFLPDVAGFDADFFGISPREAEAMDPQQRVLLEVAWEALEHAGIAPDCVGGTRPAVMMGVYYNEYQTASAANAGYASTPTARPATPTASRWGGSRTCWGCVVRRWRWTRRVRRRLVAVHLACQSLRLRESDLALAGGVNLILRPETQLALSQVGNVVSAGPVPCVRCGGGRIRAG